MKLESGDLALRLDRQGYWCSARIGHLRLRRLLDGALLLAGRRVEMDDPHWLSAQQRVRALIWRLGASLEAPPALLGRAAERLPDDYRELAAHYRRVYAEPVPILPPDRYADHVVQPTLGCPNGRCRFCDYYRGSRFRSLDTADWREHLAGVETLLGRPEAGDGIFLGGANALALPQSRLLETLDSLNQAWGRTRRGVASFFDPEHAPARSQSDWTALNQAGLAKVVIGLETGWLQLRGRLGKRANLARLRAACEDCASAGIRIGLTVLAGLGRGASGQRHCRETLAAVRGLPLDRNDQIYVSLVNQRIDQSWARAQAHELTDRLRQALDCRVLAYQAHRFQHFS